MFEEILNSKIKIKLIKLFLDRNVAFSGSEISRILKISKSRTSECLKDLEEKGVLQKTAAGRTILYSFASNAIAQSIKNAMNEENKILQRIENEFTSECKRFRPVSIVLFGSAIDGLKSSSDIDILVLYKNSIDMVKISEIASRITAESGIHLSPLVMKVDKFTKNVRNGEEFAINVVAKYKLLYGKNLEGLL